MSKMGKYFPFSDMRNFFEAERRTKIDSFIFLCYEGLLSFGIARAFFFGGYLFCFVRADTPIDSRVVFVPFLKVLTFFMAFFF